MDKPKRQKLKKDELDKVEFWANWREAGRAMGLMPSLKRHDEFGQYMENAIANFEAESLFIAFEKANWEGWTRYVQDHPPSPEALAILVILGLEQHHGKLRAKGGKAKGAPSRKTIADAIANRGEKSQKVVEAELREKGIRRRTIERHIAGKWPKNPKT